jgi:hypothetical protein
MYDLHAERLIRSPSNVEMYYLGKVGCRFESWLFNLELYHNNQYVAAEWYEQNRKHYVQAIFTATGCLRRLFPNRDVRRLILQQCGEQDWISPL